MTTRLIVKSNIALGHEDNNLLQDMIQEISYTDKIEVTFKYNNLTNTYNSIYSIECDDTNKDYIEMIIKSLNAHRYKPYEKYANIRPTDFEIDIESSVIENVQFVNSINLSFLDDKIKMMDYIISMQIQEQNELTNRVDMLYNYMDKAGLFNYKAVMDHIIEKLDDAGIINKKTIDDHVQPKTIH